MSTEGLPPVLTVEEAAALLRLKRSTAYELVRRGQIPSFRVGRFIRVPRDALLRMVEQAGRKDESCADGVAGRKDRLCGDGAVGRKDESSAGDAASRAQGRGGGRYAPGPGGSPRGPLREGGSWRR